MESSPKREKFFEMRKFTGILSRMDSDITMKSISNYEQVYDANEEVEEESFANQSLLVGSRAKQKFWNLYKSERKFKDFDPEQESASDPRFAYF